AGPGMAFPLFQGKPSHLPLFLAIAQILLALAVWYFFQVRQHARWRLPFNIREAPAFSWRYLLLAGPATILLFIGLAVGCVLLGLSTQLQSLTGGYVKIRPDGVYLVERKFQLADREVRLAGMMHIARGEFYAGLLPSIDPAVPSVVLVEGVTDRGRLLGGRTLDYGRLAKLLNVTSQTDSVFSQQVAAGLGSHYGGQGGGSGRDSTPPKGTGIHFKHADVDVESFHPATIAFILAVVALFQSNDFHHVIQSLADPSSPVADEGVQEQVVEDILFARNQRLVAELESCLKDYRCVVIPWGAMHLPEVELWLRSHNFAQSGEIERKALAFW
ncbi:MAG TPA: hypothetical protein VIS99_15970, partial [Terrimicrobiaceae bacterium]